MAQKRGKDRRKELTSLNSLGSGQVERIWRHAGCSSTDSLTWPSSPIASPTYFTPLLAKVINATSSVGSPLSFSNQLPGAPEQAEWCWVVRDFSDSLKQNVAYLVISYPGLATEGKCQRTTPPVLTELTSSSPWAPHTHHVLQLQLLHPFLVFPLGKEVIRS